MQEFMKISHFSTYIPNRKYITFCTVAQDKVQLGLFYDGKGYLFGNNGGSTNPLYK